MTSVGLTKRFASVNAVDSLDLVVPTGSLFGFLGPNGSGKTTTIRMLLGLVYPTAGSYSVLGSSGTDMLGHVGTLVEGPAFHPYLSGRANLARLDAADRRAEPRTARRRIADALDRVGLSAAAGKTYRTYSLGMRQRLGIAAALLEPRELLIFDEPTNGLDPQGTRQVRALLVDLVRDGATVFLSTHLLGEVEQLCTDVGVMSAGKLVWQGELSALRAEREPRVRVETTRLDDAERVLGELGMSAIRRTSSCVSATLSGIEPERVVESLVRDGVGIRGFAVERAGLEDRFVSLTGEGFDVSQ